MPRSDRAVVDAIVARTADAASIAWAHDGTGDVATLPDPEAAIDAAGRLGNVSALQSVAQPKVLRKAAAAALHGIRSRGVVVPEKVDARHVGLARETVDIPARAFLGMPDIDGEIELLLTVADDEGCCVLGAVLDGRPTPRESQHAHVSRSGMREVWKTCEGRGDIAEVSFVTGLHYGDHFLANDHGWRHFCEHVSPATIASARLLDPLARPPAARTDEGADDPWILPVRLLSAAAIHAGIGEIGAAFSSAIEVDDATRQSRIEGAIANAATAALTDALRPSLVAAVDLAHATFVLHGLPQRAERAVQAREQILAGVAGADIKPVLDAVRLAMFAHAMQQAGERPGG